ncbi:hypothetical protein D1AOALGA4SA_5010 [Olavius algarvensis Delta 1 endosymbiont]|nr:hypothetical protein D1AOALGA4SA_5010 [Olavius algarvensis Delta 1 endosymbiont]
MKSKPDPLGPDLYFFKNLCNLRNLWIKCLFGCGSAALGLSSNLIFPIRETGYE